MNVIVAVVMVMLTGPNGQSIAVNPNEVVSVRDPRGQGHFDSSIHCLLHTVDGKVITVVETCAEAQRKLEENK